MVVFLSKTGRGQDGAPEDLSKLKDCCGPLLHSQDKFVRSFTFCFVLTMCIYLMPSHHSGWESSVSLSRLPFSLRCTSLPLGLNEGSSCQFIRQDPPGLVGPYIFVPWDYSRPLASLCPGLVGSFSRMWLGRIHSPRKYVAYPRDCCCPDPHMHTLCQTSVIHTTHPQSSRPRAPRNVSLQSMLTHTHAHSHTHNISSLTCSTTLPITDTHFSPGSDPALPLSSAPNIFVSFFFFLCKLFIGSL